MVQSYDLTFYTNGGLHMYDYVKDKQFLKEVKTICSDIVNQLVQAINRDDKMYVHAYLVGSGAKNLITQNASNPIDLDYNLEIIESYELNIRDGRSIKEYVRKKFNAILSKNSWSDCNDSTSAFTTEQRVLCKGNKTPFSIDVCIVREDINGLHRLIHRKFGNIYFDEYYWNLAPNSRDLSHKVEKLKPYYWLELRKIYLEKKNMYLTRNDHEHNSFIIYIESVNEAYNKYCR